jgi:hypothetical protein
MSTRPRLAAPAMIAATAAATAGIGLAAASPATAEPTNGTTDGSQLVQAGRPHLLLRLERAVLDRAAKKVPAKKAPAKKVAAKKAAR